jgi:CrcB protein
VTESSINQTPGGPEVVAEGPRDDQIIRRLPLLKVLPLVAIGGGIGAVARWGVQEASVHLGGALTVSLLIVNLLGSFMLGIVFARLDTRFPSLLDIDLPPGFEPGRRPMHPVLTAAVIGGGLGAFTTYSTLCLEVIRLWQAGEIVSATLLISLSLILGPLAVAIGVRVGHRSHPAVRGR